MRICADKTRRLHVKLAIKGRAAINDIASWLLNGAARQVAIDDRWFSSFLRRIIRAEWRTTASLITLSLSRISL